MNNTTNMSNPYEIHEAIARNAVVAFTEPGENDQPVLVRRTCREIILLGIAYDRHMRATSAHAASMPIPSANSMLEDYMAVHWASIEPAHLAAGASTAQPVTEAQERGHEPNAGAQAPSMPPQQAAGQASLCPSCGGMHGLDQAQNPIPSSKPRESCNKTGDNAEHGQASEGQEAQRTSCAGQAHDELSGLRHDGFSQ